MKILDRLICIYTVGSADLVLISEIMSRLRSDLVNLFSPRQFFLSRLAHFTGDSASDCASGLHVPRRRDHSVLRPRCGNGTTEECCVFSLCLLVCVCVRALFAALFADV